MRGKRNLQKKIFNLEQFDMSLCRPQVILDGSGKLVVDYYHESDHDDIDEEAPNGFPAGVVPP
jgi:hypothetical protein